MEEDIIYTTGNGNGMTVGDVWTWVKWLLQTGEDFGRCFDTITGGAGEFSNTSVYLELRTAYETLSAHMNAQSRSISLSKQSNCEL